MGLDMYLTAEVSLYDMDKDKRSAKIRRIFPDMYKSGNINYIRVGFEAGYWRKANHIHKWFVDNVQEGKDDCGYHYVSREKLTRLLSLCKTVIGKHNLSELHLPTQAGFFFGSTEYDDGYYLDIRKTIEIIEKCLKLPDCWSFVYHSSW